MPGSSLCCPPCRVHSFCVHALAKRWFFSFCLQGSCHLWLTTARGNDLCSCSQGSRRRQYPGLQILNPACAWCAGLEDWETVAQWPFVEQSKSPRALYRAFYVPQISQHANHVSDYVILKRGERSSKHFWSGRRL